uniref:Uncharacterized protein n=1 Tax=Cannabis sativa TaxID=3483 RepID=A0A803Q8R5_CANSA
MFGHLSASHRRPSSALDEALARRQGRAHLLAFIKALCPVGWRANSPRVANREEVGGGEESGTMGSRRAAKISSMGPGHYKKIRYVRTYVKTSYT